MKEGNEIKMGMKGVMLKKMGCDLLKAKKREK